MKRAYKFAFTVTKLKIGHNWVLYNWLNTKNVFFDDHNHPMYIYLDNNSRFIYFSEDAYFIDDFTYLVENYFLVPNQDVIRKIVSDHYSLAINNKNLSLTLMPVNQSCNFKCVYCYEDANKSQFMGSTELKALINFITRSKPETLRIDYFGGEPLLNIKFIKDLNKSLMDLEKRNGFTLTPSSMTTNGYLLTKDVFFALHDLRITSYQITVDGDKENHDMLRPHKNGLGSYDIIYKNLADMALSDKRFSLTLRTNFSVVTGAPDARIAFLERIKSDFKGDKRFIFMPDMISRWRDNEKKNSRIHFSKTAGNRVKQMFEQEAEALGLETLSVVMLSSPESHYCYAARPNNIIVFPCDGDGNLTVQKCTLEIDNDDNIVGYISSDGLFTKNSNWEYWVKNNLFSSKKCLNCSFILHCFGNACVNLNNKRNKTFCPRDKFNDKMLVERILVYISRNSNQYTTEGGDQFEI